MKNLNMFFNCIQSFISKCEIDSILESLEYKDSARKFTVENLLYHWVASSVEGWKSFRDSEVRSKTCSLVCVDFSTFSKKAKDVPFQFFKEIFSMILNKSNREIRRSLAIPNQIIAVDSTTITFGESKLPWAKYHGEKSGIKLHVHLDVDTFSPVKIQETTGLVHDSIVSKNDFFDNAILVKDRAYADFKTFDKYKNIDQSFVIRIKNNSQFLSKKSLQRLKIHESSVYEDFTCVLGTKHNHSSKRHRVIFFKDYNGKEIRVCTNLMYLSAETIAQIYKIRWNIEVFFKWLKQNLNMKKVFGTTENAVYGQLYSGLIAYLILRIIYNYTYPKTIIFKYSFIDFFRSMVFESLPTEWFILIYKFLKNTW